MRIPILISIILFLSQVGIGQYAPIASTDSISWNLKHEIPDAAQMETIFLGDTVKIDSLIYFEIIHQWHGKVGYFREDTTQGKVWFRGNTANQDTVIMDLTLGIGDSFTVRMNIHGHRLDPVKSEVTSVDTIRGKKVVTLDYHFGGGFISESLQFIEGIGPNASLLYAHNKPYSINYELGFLVCTMHEKDSLIYAWDTVDQECGRFIGIRPRTDDPVKVYPNPVHSTIVFDLQNAGAAILVIRSLDGRMVRQEAIVSTAYLDLHGLSGGVWIYEIYRENEPPITGKFLKVSY